MIRALFLSLVPVLLIISGCGDGASTSFLIRNVIIVDGTGNAPLEADLRVLGAEILEIGDLQVFPGETVIDGGGKILAPGFIDTHSHHDRGMLKDPDMLSVTSQGITTIIIGADGGSWLPVEKLWRNLEEIPVAVNVGTFSGHNSIRRQVMGDNYQREAVPHEIRIMSDLVKYDLEYGALGLSTGLEYDPGIYSNAQEVITLAKLAYDYGGVYSSHLRSEDRYLWKAIEEIINIGKTTGVPVHISHMKIAISRDWGKADSLVAILNDARNRGVQISADVYPYEYWQSTMTVLLPERDFDDLEAARFAINQLTTPENMYITKYEAQESLEGKTLAEIAAERNEKPEKTYLDLIKKSISEEKAESVICKSMAENDIRVLFEWGFANVCSDGSLRSGHPRGRGAFPRFFKQAVNEHKYLSMESAIHKMTGQAAENLRIRDRGYIREGMKADLVLFDPTQIMDRATIEDPDALSDGIIKVWVNGETVFDDGKSTGNRPGKFVRRGL